MTWIKWNGRQVENQFAKACSDAVFEAVEATGDYADSNEVPRDEGYLIESKHIEREGTGTATYIGYGGGGVTGKPIVPYALKWHFTQANFQKGRKSRYLIDPMSNQYPRFLKRAIEKRGLTYVG